MGGEPSNDAPSRGRATHSDLSSELLRMCSRMGRLRESRMEFLKGPPSPRARTVLALSAALLSGLKAFLWIARETKPRDFDQVWHAANAFLAGRNPYAEIGPGLAFDWPAPLYYPLPAVLSVVPLTQF